ncbi:MAG: 7-cyano-7-deazaguanine synthase [Hydrogenobacter thermophilus]|uniref:7-cyano-7-deazaguanine synthase n=1 Tax=Hydrogenobacter thermophilus TaxID=940 RepID=UPI001C77F137|nr:7-cyano-7-deazaguanine synthase [Hydrogenobacter thermophilus]MCS7284186.1 7-cyano-7-deazaguanine synthase [Hydrogenobacter thermophilus]QWK18939.1 MAG: 7-cyano-7-deazaguanine synthase [Hydrogenobacter thermophilus]
MSAHKIAVLFSGGVESTTLLYMYLQRKEIVYPVYIKMGESWERLELENALRLWQYTKSRYASLRPLRVINLQMSGAIRRSPYQVSEIFIPLRNMSLITACALYALSKKVRRLAIGSLGLYPFPDNSKSYIKELERLISEGSGTAFSIEMPFFGLEKGKIVKEFYGKVPYHLTLSCAMPKKVGKKILHCGKCIKCKERQEALLG